MGGVDAALDRLVELAAARARIEAEEQVLLAELADADDSGKNWVREEIACLLRLSFPVVQDRLRTAHALVYRFPATLELLRTGRVGYWHAHTLVEHTDGLDDDVAARVEDRVLPRAAEQTVSAFRGCVRRAVHAFDAATQQQAHIEAVSQRRVCLSPEDHGMAWLNAYLPAVDATAMMTAVQALADKAVVDAGDMRTADQRRADALVALCIAPLTGSSPDLPTQQGRKPAVQITLALSTLMALDDQPGELAGYGPIPSSVARALAVDATASWRWLLTDDEGRLLDLSKTTYAPSAALRDFVIARDRTCRFPGCNRQACRCELDHAVPFDGTNTTIANVHALCCRHHHGKHDAGWTVSRTGDGVTSWTSPTGRRYDKPPDPYPRDTTTGPPAEEPADDDPAPPF